MATTKKYNIEIDVESKTLGQLEGDLAAINEELKDVDRNSEAFKTLTKQAQILNKEIEKTNNEIEGLKLEDKLMAADGAAKVFGGSLSSVVGTLGVLGVESEAFGEFEKKAASAIAVGLGVKDVAEGFGNLSIVMKKSGIAAKLFGNTTKVALIATGMGAFVVLLGTVIAYWDDITAAVKKFAASNAFVTKAIDGIKGAFNSLFDAARPVLEFLGLLPDEAERAQIAISETANEAITQLEREIAIATAAGESAKDLYDLRSELIKQELIDLKASNADKEEIFAKETELMALNAAEQRRIREEAAASREEAAKKLAAQQAEAEKLAKEKAAEDAAIAAEKEAERLVKEAEKAAEEAKKAEEAAEAKRIIDEAALEERERIAKSDMVIQSKLDAARQSSLDNIIAIAGAESKVGKAALIAKQVLAAQELVMEVSKTVTFSAQAAARSTVAVAEGTAQTAKIGFPQNIPLLIGYAAQAAGIIMAIKSATSAAGAATQVETPSMPSMGGRSSMDSSTPSFQADAPQTFTNTAPTIKAYVLSGDVRSSAEADAKIDRRRTID